MEHEYSGLNHHSINEAFYSEHPKLNGPVKIFNHLHYLMGEYSIKTGIAKWQRVIPAAQRDKLERWLGAHYPVNQHNYRPMNELTMACARTE